MFVIISKHRVSGKEARSTVELRSYNFYTASSLREILREKKVHGAFVYGSDQEIGQLGEYLFFEAAATERTGINTIGIERLDSGEAVVVTRRRYITVAETNSLIWYMSVMKS
ncbi:hypothetical protein [Paenibacillus tuaregi]|uniref:hypothetical protein n=1 Tax=Paenibacillus tuaregi TaxID=1816681 RepID=UPI0011DCA22D|nr:hypothetical protein [Paenibacillus tuaregi]